VAGCGTTNEPSSESAGDDPAGTTVRVVTHDSFDLTPEVLASFEQQTGITVELIAGGDAVAMVNQAILTAGNPVADVLFGIDDNQLAAAREAGLFAPHVAAARDTVRSDVAVPEGDLVTPIDVGDVCVNYDREWFAQRGIAPPDGLEDLTDPLYASQFIVQNPATSSPGLAFLLATVAAFGDDYTSYWERLVANDVAVSDGWEEAYYGEFSGGSGEGERPLVVSYATSPPAEVYYSETYAADVEAGTLPAEAPTGVVADTCFRQVEYAGVLAGSTNVAGAELFIDFLLSEAVQTDIPLTMFVNPVRADVALPDVFVRYAGSAGDVWSLPADEIDAGRRGWVEEWRRIVLG
jgi:thiamine transport system substrate-binding protein